MFYFDYKATVTSANDTNPLTVTGYVKVYFDEEKTIYFTEIPFPRFSFAEAFGKTIEEFNILVEGKVNEIVNSEEWQNKLSELKLAYDLGLYVPQAN